MNIKHILLTFTLLSLVATEPIMAAVERNEKAKQAESTFQTFKKDIKCAFSRKGCSREQKIRLLKQGLTLLGAVTLLYIGYYAWDVSTEKEYYRGFTEGYQLGQPEGAKQAFPEKIRDALQQKQEAIARANENVMHLVRLRDFWEKQVKRTNKQEDIAQRNWAQSHLEEAQQVKLKLEIELKELLQKLKELLQTGI